MSGSRSHHHLHVHGTSPVHRLAPQAKLLGLVGFVIVVAATPRHLVLAFVLDACIVVAVMALARLKPRTVLTRLGAITPFVAFALLLPFIGQGPRSEVFGVSLSSEGLWAMWNVMAKASLGASAGIILTATTPIPDIITGMSRLRVPATFVAIVAFMFRYLDLALDGYTRMRRSMLARGHDPRWLWQARPIASSTGTLFVRTYERGERVHDAMLARGFTGTMPELAPADPRPYQWVPGLLPAVLAVVGTAILVLR